MLKHKVKALPLYITQILGIPPNNCLTYCNGTFEFFNDSNMKCWCSRKARAMLIILDWNLRSCSTIFPRLLHMIEIIFQLIILKSCSTTLTCCFLWDIIKFYIVGIEKKKQLTLTKRWKKEIKENEIYYKRRTRATNLCQRLALDKMVWWHWGLSCMSCS